MAEPLAHAALCGLSSIVPIAFFMESDPASQQDCARMDLTNTIFAITGRNMLNRLLAIASLAAALPLGGYVQAEPTSGPATVVYLRPYIGGTGIYIRLSSAVICGVDTFLIDMNSKNGKEAYAGALMALASGKKIQVEISSATGCKGWGTALQSIYLLSY